ncbi:MAG: Coenzyme F420 hydrogenase/dehydrogenase, beta subunit C-terminal domain [candidate division WOR-3 bacterium]
MEEKVSALLVPAVSSTGVFSPALISTPEKVADTAPLLPAMTVNSASIIAEIAPNPVEEGVKVAVVLRPCELRAVVELVKLKQVALDNLVLVGIDCPGTYRASDFAEISHGDSDFNNRFVRNQDGYLNEERFRSACQNCEFPTPLVSDLTFGFLGIDPEQELIVVANTAKGEALLEGLELKIIEGTPASRERFLEKFCQARKEKAAQRIAEFDKVGLGPENLMRYFARCLNCHNCMHVCPVCYCRECFFESEALARELDEQVRLSRHKGITRMPAGTMLFHLTRMNHMMTSCVQCGICEDSCPVQIGLSVLFKKVSRAAQEEFGYLSGRSLEEPLPLTTFREDEFRTIGED